MLVPLSLLPNLTVLIEQDYNIMLSILSWMHFKDATNISLMTYNTSQLFLYLYKLLIWGYFLPLESYTTILRLATKFIVWLQNLLYGYKRGHNDLWLQSLRNISYGYYELVCMCTHYSYKNIKFIHTHIYFPLCQVT